VFHESRFILTPSSSLNIRANEAFARVQAANRMIESPYFPFKRSYYANVEVAEDNVDDEQNINNNNNNNNNNIRQGYASSFADYQAKMNQDRRHGSSSNSSEGYSYGHRDSEGGFKISPLFGVGLLALAFLLQLSITFIGARSEQQRIKEQNLKTLAQIDNEGDISVVSKKEPDTGASGGVPKDEEDNKKQSTNSSNSSSSPGNVSLLPSFLFGRKTNEEVSQHQKAAQMRGREILKGSPLENLNNKGE
jgi:hypothetical protein